jgi:hypothetical protein
MTWKDLAWLREHTRLPILLKGILSAEDARLAIEHDVAGIIVSNHGGRQVDGAVAAINALPEVVKVAKGRLPVLFDSGIRSGSDMFKALALGASAICLGRPYVYGLAITGERGVREVIQNILAEFDLTIGTRRVRDVGRCRERRSGKSRVDRYPTSSHRRAAPRTVTMNKLQFKSSWNEVKGKLKQKYAQSTDDDLLRGRQRRRVSGKTPEEARRERRGSSSHTGGMIA